MYTNLSNIIDLATIIWQFLHAAYFEFINYFSRHQPRLNLSDALKNALTPTMGPGLHCVRHAQGYHNLCIANHSIHDPLLTPYGEEQCRTLQKNFPHMQSVDLVVASPMKRTINTALIGFEPVLKEKDLKIIALPELQETSDLPCDTGSSPDELAKEFEGKPVDFSLVKPGWNVKRMKWAPTATAIEKRARDARLWLLNRPEKNIVVVSHGS